MEAKDTPAPETIRAILETEKEISFKAGMQEMVDWINGNWYGRTYKGSNDQYFMFVDKWQAFLKEKGLVKK